VHPWAEDFIQVHCVAHGTCCFPRYTECPFQKFTASGVIDLRMLKDNIKDEFWSNRHEASPKVFQGGVTSDGIGCAKDCKLDSQTCNGACK
jgi:hypothetical protein